MYIIVCVRAAGAAASAAARVADTGRQLSFNFLFIVRLKGKRNDFMRNLLLAVADIRESVIF